MAVYSRQIKDRIADGDDCFYIEQLGDGRVRLIPAPNSVTEPGTDINHELLQLIEDRVVSLMNLLTGEIATNPFHISFASLDGLAVTGVWNTESSRIEC